MTSENVTMQGPVCPLPISHYDHIMLGHGSGGKMTHDLVKRLFASAFNNEALAAGDDSASLPLPAAAQLEGRLSFTTDSHIVSPLFFPGGDIGRLAVCGTVNDLCMLGAEPLYLTAGFILEEGLSIEILQRVVRAMQAAAIEAGVQIVAGDTKVVEKGKADGLFINTAGLGWIPAGRHISGSLARPGDVVLISGSLGDHGMAVLTARGELGLETGIQSDVAPLNSLIAAVLKAAPNTHVLRDPTRGGLGTTLNEIAAQSKISIWLDETAIPVSPAVRSACEMLGFDPLYVANEGKVIVILPAAEAQAGLAAMKQHPLGQSAAKIGEIKEGSAGRVQLRTAFGSTRILDMLAGEMLPRIC
ncbi:MAG TPA: hydrogenase expression/formation protein HypE [Anaerolineaceae bacterium]|nr:hydrogenase expression/formation protein HypE [Anaerolineaceae bacterium]HPN50884.1 hydrogenase expression/formation protein HypE [Anaerolineaceae bacterium]